MQSCCRNIGAHKYGIFKICTGRIFTRKPFDLPILIGASRKSFIGDLLNLPEQNRLYGSLAAATIAVLNGAKIIRTHDVKATMDAVSIAIVIIDQTKNTSSS